MSDKLKSAKTRTTTFVRQHQIAITAAVASTATAAAMVALGNKRTEQWNEFLEEKNLTNEFYSTDI